MGRDGRPRLGLPLGYRGGPLLGKLLVTCSIDKCCSLTYIVPMSSLSGSTHACILC